MSRVYQTIDSLSLYSLLRTPYAERFTPILPRIIGDSLKPLLANMLRGSTDTRGDPRLASIREGSAADLLTRVGEPAFDREREPSASR